MTRAAENNVPSLPETAIDMTIDEPRWRDALPDLEKMAQETVVKTLAVAEASLANEISLRFTNDMQIRELNSRYRNKDKPTNVLSFPQEEEGLLGDVVLAFETVEREALEQNKSFADHARHLLVHGVLHLLGHDHEKDEEAERMEALEITVLKLLGVKNPYESGYIVP